MSHSDGTGPEGVVVIEASEHVGDDPVVAWALSQLGEALASAGLLSLPPSAGSEEVVRIVAALADEAVGQDLAGAELTGPVVSESFAVVRPDGDVGPIVVVGADGRGLAYGLSELSDITALSDDPLSALRHLRGVTERPVTPVRSISRAFSSEVEDKPWFYDREFWAEYLSELATQRINRLQLALGMQYNYSHHVARDNYFYFAYPFLVDVPGFSVRVENLDDAERERNLETLRFISAEAKRRGIHFQLGLWNHAYRMLDGPPPRYPISGLSDDNHAAYCAAALAQVLRECPAIDGLTLRVHYEGGVVEPGHEFWRTVMGAVTAADRPVEIDMHAKGVDEALIEVARQSGAKVVLSAKYCAEHRTLPYHQTVVRGLERRGGPSQGLSQITQQRRFTRYGYGDFLREDRDYDVMFRIWPGTQRLFISGDPVLGAGYGRLGTLAGAIGVELCEPLSFKGRQDSGGTASRDCYADPALQLGRDDWKKYLYTYRLWGRLLYNPDADPSSWQRYLQHHFGAAAGHVEVALGAASRVLPLVTLIHGLGASYNGYWPEMYINMPVANGARSEHYDGDTADPKTFGSVSSFDPMLFDRIDDHADDLVAGRRSGRYTPTQTATWLEQLAETADRHLHQANLQVDEPFSADYRRIAVDIAAQAGLARFFAGKSRAGLAYALYQRTEDPSYLGDGLDAYRAARDAFATVAEVTTDVYRADVGFGARDSEHGHWADRLPAIDDDIAALEAERDRAEQAATANRERTRRRALPVVAPGERPPMRHRAPASFSAGADLPLELRADRAFAAHVVLHYRHLNQGEDYHSVGMIGDGQCHRATIPSAYTDSAYPMAYFFTVHAESGDAWLVPGLDDSLANQPYYLVRQRRGASDRLAEESRVRPR